MPIVLIGFIAPFLQCFLAASVDSPLFYIGMALYFSILISLLILSLCICKDSKLTFPTIPEAFFLSDTSLSLLPFCCSKGL